MPDSEGPWGRRPQQPIGARSRLRVIVWVVSLFVLALVVWTLSDLFPGRIYSDFDQAQLVKLLAILVLVSASLVFARQIKVREFVRNIAIWAGIASVLFLGFTFQDELNGVFVRVRSELIPGYPVTTDSKVMALSESSDGHFRVVSKINGTLVTFLIDTGASGIVLSPADAKRAGINFQSLGFTLVYETANGLGRGAPYTAASLSIGPIELANVTVSINQTDMRESLLGMSFLKRMASLEIQGRRMFLHWN